MLKKNNTSNIKNIIFDLGGVLIDWNPDYVFQNEFKGNKEQLKVFYEKVCTFEWNENQSTLMNSETFGNGQNYPNKTFSYEPPASWFNMPT